MRILSFYTEGNPVCESINKLLRELSYDVEYINVFEDIAKVDIYNICVSPTVIVLDGEVEVKRFAGMGAVEKIIDCVKKLA